MSGCPGSTEAGCRCWEHHPGLAKYAPDPVAYERVLAKARRKTGPISGAIPFEKPCDGSMVCSCKKCSADKAQRVAKSKDDGHQPWQPRVSRRQERLAA